MANYKIVNVAANKCLNIYGDNVTSLKNNQNVTLWADSGASEQIWVIDSLGNGVVVKSSVDNRFGLNAYRSSASKYNCDVYPWSGNETDAKVNFVATSGGYRIKLANYDMYLTAGGTNNGADVYWAPITGATTQMWSCVPVTGPKKHSYFNVSANDMNLHIIETDASNIQMVNMQKKTGGMGTYFGINGGFFNFRPSSDVSCLNYAINNGVPVGPNGTGAINDLGFAAIAYVNGMVKLLPAILKDAADLRAALGGATPTWVQGGGNLMLGNEDWGIKDLRFSDEALVSSTGRTAIVANTATKKVYLIVSRESAAKRVVDFRDAIHKYFKISEIPGGTSTFIGLLLDGGDSSCIRAKNSAGRVVDVNTGRPLCQVITLKDAN